MPTIDVFPDVLRAYNRVEVDWTDYPTVEFARVLRVDVESGTCTPLRPYTCFFGDYLKLSCGTAIFWDTEVPLDRQVYYITEALDGPCPPASYLFLDTFTRDLVDSWGSTETGTLSPLAYALAGGTVGGNYDVNGGKGRQTNNTVNVFRTATVDIGSTDFNIQADVSTDVTALTQAITSRLVGRFTDVNNSYFAGINWDQTGQVSIFILRVVAGVATILTPIPMIANYVPGQEFTIRFQAISNRLKLKVWETGDAEPAAWNLEVTDPTPIVAGTRVGSVSRLNSGNTNPVAILSTDNFFASDPCVPCQPVTADTSATPTTMASNGAFRLRNPVRPCDDLYVPLCFAQTQQDPNCVPGQGIFFASMEAESYDSNSIVLNPVNARRPLAVSRQRRDVSSVLTLVTRTFADRDALLRLADPGNPLLLSGPPQYGINDRYMAVSELTIERGVTDHKFPVRIATLPYVAVDRPAGPSQGVCGSRMADLCDIYSTFDEMNAAGLTWADLIRGDASHDDEMGP